MKDWTGNKNSIYKTLGASNHTDKEREVHDYYATEPKALELLLMIALSINQSSIKKELITHYGTPLEKWLLNH